MEIEITKINEIFRVELNGGRNDCVENNLGIEIWDLFVHVLLLGNASHFLYRIQNTYS